jgi:hypothetical protein
MKTIALTILFCLSCSFAFALEGDYVCGGVGLRLLGEKALFAERDLVLCGKVGVTSLYAESCEEKSVRKFALAFDELAENIRVLKDNKERSYFCRKK